MMDKTLVACSAVMMDKCLVALTATNEVDEKVAKLVVLTDQQPVVQMAFGLVDEWAGQMGKQSVETLADKKVGIMESLKDILMEVRRDVLREKLKAEPTAES